jgi:hypothetical protein
MRLSTTLRCVLFALAAAACGGGQDVVLGTDAPDGGYDPCAGKNCGDSCQLCRPNDPNCVETSVVKWCNAKGACLDGVPPVCG